MPVEGTQQWLQRYNLFLNINNKNYTKFNSFAFCNNFQFFFEKGKEIICIFAFSFFKQINKQDLKALAGNIAPAETANGLISTVICVAGGGKCLTFC